MNRSSSYSPELKALQKSLHERSLGIQIFEATVFILIEIVTFCGNFLLSWTLYNNPRLRTIPHMFVASLSVSDILMSVLVMPLTIASLVHGKWIFSSSICYYHGFFLFYFAMVSLHTLTAISINRYFVIVRPNIAKRIFTKKRTVAIIVIIWILTIFYVLPGITIPSAVYEFQPGKSTCMYLFESNPTYSLVLDIVFIISPMNVMFYCYFKVYKEVRNNQNRVAAMRGNDNTSHSVNVEEVKVTKSLAIVLFGFLLCWIPIGVIDVFDLSQKSPTLPRQVYLMYICLAYLSSSFNPFIYGAMNKKFRAEYKKFFGCKKEESGDGNSTLSTRVDIETQSKQ